MEIGQKVICINAQDSSFLEEGETYKVKEVCYEGTHLTLEPQEYYDGGESSYSVNRFEVA